MSHNRSVLSLDQVSNRPCGRGCAFRMKSVCPSRTAQEGFLLMCESLETRRNQNQLQEPSPNQFSAAFVIGLSSAYSAVSCNRILLAGHSGLRRRSMCPFSRKKSAQASKRCINAVGEFVLRYLISGLRRNPI